MVAGVVYAPGCASGIGEYTSQQTREEGMVADATNGNDLERKNGACEGCAKHGTKTGCYACEQE